MSVHEINPILIAVQQAAMLAQRVQDDYLTRLNKSGNEPVTIADYGVQAIINRAIHRAFPHDAIIAEESATGFKRSVKPEQQTAIAQLVGAVLGESVSIEDIIMWLDYGQDTVSASTWIVDPIDGTKGFLAQRTYVIGVGLVEGGQAAGAVLGVPTIDEGELLVAWDGNAYRAPLYGDLALAPLRVSERGVGDTVYTVDAASRADGPITQRLKEVFTLGDALMQRVDAQLEIYVRIARGDADLFVCKPVTRCSNKVWDHAAGVALVEAAGGAVSDFDGGALNFGDGERIPNGSIAASNGRLHDVVLDSVKLKPRYV
jgi:3'(2'), 5'-bisphosphate nucleotidase